VKAYLDEGIYQKGQKVPREEMQRLKIKPCRVCPELNYTIRPRHGAPFNQ
jgi:hypothetical protein